MKKYLPLLFLFFFVSCNTLPPGVTPDAPISIGEGLRAIADAIVLAAIVQAFFNK